MHSVAPVPSAENVPAGHAPQVKPLPPSEQLVPLAHGSPPPMHVPAAHTSPLVQDSPSLQAVPVVGPHVPSVAAPLATEHAWQSSAPPPHAESQHTPSVQKPLSQSSSVWHASPTTAMVA